jgi:BlaI family penicillinase repressor
MNNKMNKKPELAAAEWEIMKIVWQEEPCAAGTVQDALQISKNWAYSTVKTTMDRMVKKNFLKTKSIRNLQLFSSNITEEEAKRNEIFKTIKRAFNGALTPMMQFLLQNENFSDEELIELRKLVKNATRKK